MVALTPAPKALMPYSLHIQMMPTESTLSLHISDSPYSTESIPQIVNLLEESLPSIFSSTCYNPDNLPFMKEVMDTELGHLYEHILLENIAKINNKEGLFGEYTGTTEWNWYQTPLGLFQITVNIGSKDSLVLYQAIENTNRLFHLILENRLN